MSPIRNSILFPLLLGAALYSVTAAEAGVSFRDDFNRSSNTDLGVGWNEYLPDLQLINREVGNSNADNLPKGAVITQALGPDQDVSVDCKVTAPGNSCGVTARWSSERNYYRARLDAGQGTLALTKTVDGETITLAAANRPLQVNVYYHIRLVVQGSSLSVFFGNEVAPVLSLTDTSLAAGDFAGIRSFATARVSTFFDNFSAAAIVPDGADLSLSMTASPSAATAGNNLIYLITATNAGPSVATEVALSDILPAGTALISATPSQGGCAFDSGKVTCDLGMVGGEAAATVSLVLTPNAAGEITNGVSVSAKENDPDLSNNQVQITTQVGDSTGSSADLAVSISPPTAPDAAGSDISYTVTISNAGPEAAVGLVLSDSFPGSVNLVSAAASGGSCAKNAGILCLLGALKSGASATVTLVVTPTTQGDLSHSAVVTSSTPDPNRVNNSIKGAISVAAPAPDEPSGGNVGGPPVGGAPPPAGSSGGGGGCSFAREGHANDDSLNFLLGGVLILFFWRRRVGALSLRGADRLKGDL